nr:type II toxin-antitoxin system Phd/YefM family antitoxin [Ardenticatena sp.]
MQILNIHQAKTHLSERIEAVERGEEAIIARADRPVARLTPLPAQRRLGLLEGRLTVPPDFDAPLPNGGEVP